MDFSEHKKNNEKEGGGRERGGQREEDISSHRNGRSGVDSESEGRGPVTAGAPADTHPEGLPPELPDLLQLLFFVQKRRVETDHAHSLNFLCSK